mgnify:CR=1 FL=1
MATDAALLFSSAERHFTGKRFEAARADLLTLGKLVGENAAVLHLLGLVEKGAGRLDAAEKALARAGVLAPRDPQVHNNHANVLGALGRVERALAAYERALKAHPGFAEARTNRALLLHKAGRPDEAREDLRKLLAAAPNHARAWNALGGVERDAGDHDAAMRAFERASAVRPNDPIAASGRARAALEAGDTSAPDLFATALRLRPGEPSLVIGLAEALHAAGDPNGPSLLADFVAAHPREAEAHRVLARMRWEAGDATGFTRDLDKAVATHPAEPDLRRVLIETLAGTDHLEGAADAARAARVALPDQPDFPLREAIHSGESGDHVRAEAAFGAVMPDVPLRGLHEALHRLRIGQVERAATLLDEERTATPESVAAWAYSGLAWRLLGDSRAAWLHEQDGLIETRPLHLSSTELAEAADVLRQLHTTSAFPVGLSLRGGTQTRGALFARRHPVIRRVADSIRQVVADHWAGLPPHDPEHPLLRHRLKAPHITGSWSVRLTASGFHVSHIHTQGQLSSACYLVVPDETRSNDDGARAGWLEIGRPPHDLGLDPIRTIQPQPGTLTLFSSTLFHGTRPFSHGERLTVAFDVAAH